MAAVVLVLFQTVTPDTNFAQLESADKLFKEDVGLTPPSADLVGSAKDGYEWVEWPHGTDTIGTVLRYILRTWSKYNN